MPARTGAEYIKSLHDNPAEVYLNGKRVKDVTTHPGLRNGVQTMAKLMEQGDHLIVGKQCRLIPYWAIKVTH